MHALIIEDQFLIATLIADILRDLGYTTFDFAEREAEAISAAKGKGPDLIVADQRLTDGTGVEAVRKICAGRSIAVVFASDYRDEVLRLVPDAILIGKPFGGRRLREAVEQAVAQAGQTLQDAD